MLSKLARKRFAFPGAALVAVVLFGANTAVAGAQAATDEVGGAVTTFGVGDWVGLIVRLALVVGIIWVAVQGLRWYVRRMNGSGARSGNAALEVMETHALGPNRSLHLVRLGDRAVLVGATQERITQLLTVDDPEELRRLTERPEAAPRETRARGGTSIVSALRMGIVAMQEQRRLSAARADRAGSRTAERAGERAPNPHAPDAEVPTTASRLSAWRGALKRQPARAGDGPQVPAAARQSLFDRTLAEADAVEQTRHMPSSAGLRARAGYGRAMVAPEAREGSADGPAERDAQIAELQRAIAAARKQAG